MNVFKKYFQRVLNKRYEDGSTVIARVIERVNSLRRDERVRIAKEILIAIPGREEIESGMKGMKNSSQG